MELAEQKCTTYKPGSPPLTRKETIELLGQVPGWALTNGHITRKYEFPDAAACITFFTEVATLSAQEGHYPDVCMKESRYVELSYYTYPAGGLTLNDFIMARKLNAKDEIA